MTYLCPYCAMNDPEHCIGFVMVPDRENDRRLRLRQRAPYRREECETRRAHDYH